jgi:hypothetical protein
MPRKIVRTIQDCPEAIAMVKKLNSYKTQLFQEGQQANIGFAIGRSGSYLHFSRPFSDPYRIDKGLTWAGWEPTITQVRALVHAMTCPMEDLVRMAIRDPDVNDYNYVRLKFIGMVKVPSTQALARNIAIARLEGKL